MPIEYASVLDRLTAGRELPKGYNEWAIKTVSFAGKTRNGFQWPLFPKTLHASGPIKPHTSACPSVEGDGLCVATTYRGMASGGRPAFVMLLCAYASQDVLGGSRSAGKLRVRRVRVVEVIDGIELLRQHGSGADLRSANLYGADLRSANLRSANLRSADLRSADLRSANLYGANLYGANLRSADLRSADLRSANLYGANLYGANLRSANLRSADHLDLAIGYKP